MVSSLARWPLLGILSGSRPWNAAAVASSLRVRRCRSPAVGLEATRCGCSTSRSSGAWAASAGVGAGGVWDGSSTRR
uniref:Uncharacterized protein n=1 Tax=Arundo donax TaxID=35708 RepID=A0A0A9BTP4_ARUDO